MKQLYSARNGLETHELRLLLAAHDIDAKVTGDNNSFETFISFSPQSAPRVFVDDADLEEPACCSFNSKIERIQLNPSQHGRVQKPASPSASTSRI
jgi:hypothetical protein